jgi:hypothetical protein
MPHNRSLVIASLELGRMLADRGKVTFRAQGTCMFPCIQPGDVLQIESRTLEQVQIGDIAVFRRGKILFGHRAIIKSIREGKPFILTRPDRTRQGDDGPTFAADVLGVVSTIERRGMRMSLQKQPLRGFASMRVAAWELWNWKLRGRLIEYIGAIQHLAWYRRLASVWFRIIGAHFLFVVRVPLAADQSHDLYREMPPEMFDVSRMSWQGKPVTRWLLALQVNGARPPAASATINWHPEGCPYGAGWHITEMLLRVRYRGVGLDEALISQVQAILRSSAINLQGINP